MSSDCEFGTLTLNDLNNFRVRFPNSKSEFICCSSELVYGHSVVCVCFDLGQFRPLGLAFVDLEHFGDLVRFSNHALYVVLLSLDSCI